MLVVVGIFFQGTESSSLLNKNKLEAIANNGAGYNIDWLTKDDSKHIHNQQVVQRPGGGERALGMANAVEPSG